MNAIQERALEVDLEAEIKPGKVLAFRQPDPDDEIGRHADVHRNAIAVYDQRVAEAKKTGKASVASLEMEKRLLKKQFDTDMERIAERIAEARADADRKAATSQKLAAASRAALAALAE